MIYLDSSAITKVLVEEPNSAALQRWLELRPHSARASSEIASVEVIRACRRVSPALADEAELLLADWDLIFLDQSIIHRAARVDPPHLRSLDAVHLTSALSVKSDLTAFVTYDRKLGSAARAAGLAVATPV